MPLKRVLILSKPNYEITASIRKLDFLYSVCSHMSQSLNLVPYSVSVTSHTPVTPSVSDF